jgi:hypothetical protein
MASRQIGKVMLETTAVWLFFIVASNVLSYLIGWSKARTEYIYIEDDGEGGMRCPDTVPDWLPGGPGVMAKL